MLAALLITASLAAPATLTDHGGSPSRAPRPIAVEKARRSSAPPPVVLAQATLAPDPNAPDHTPTFMEQYLSYQLSPVASKPVKDGLVMGHVLGYIFSIIPVCGTLWGPVVAVDGAEFSGDVAITWFLSSLLWSLVATGATFTGVGAILWFAVPYLSSTATFNAIDRQLKAKGYVAPPPGTTTTAPPGTTPPPTDTPPPSYAY